MNKQELVAAVAEAAGLSKVKAELALNAVMNTVTSELAAGNEVALLNFGTFGFRTRAARPGRNPQTGLVIELPARVNPTFRAGKALREAVN